ncbi:hypothetical protein POM88_009538 [Heracleum sosnowskyi]|uniref:F-box associated beta-propeller type 3 domain-containing protein n=1 Tax=Heracleum sosnowskyi TaxID=360622 RepID=A0AAD8N2S4_9APIA|nr:hypothetical protein POM88_009538 [Heracleum sosnowskyi]
MLDKSIYVDTCDNSTLLYMLLSFIWWETGIVCSRNGLVCVSNLATDVIYLGNPITRRFKKLPPPSDREDCEDFMLGFGFDDISIDYKILRIPKLLEVTCALQAEIVHPYPEPPDQLQQRKSFVLDFEGFAALIFNELTDDGSVSSLWTLNEVLGNWSWDREFNLDDSFKEIHVARFCLGDGQLFACGVRGYMFYDYKKRHVKGVLDQTPWV